MQVHNSWGFIDFIKHSLRTVVTSSMIFISMSPKAGSLTAADAEFELIEVTVASVQANIVAGKLSCEDLTRHYINRIQRLDQASGLNSIIMINPEALLTARRLDVQYAKTKHMAALHCTPMIVKDNFNTKDLQTTAGSVAMLGFLPEKDAWQIAKLKAVGAIVLAKSNMAEWAFSPRVTISSVAGETRNPYNLAHVPAGSSGGTAAAIASNLGLIGLGTDTGNSIRGPASHNALVGIRSTLGLTSRTGIVPLYFRNDVGGPIARTVKDATRVLQVISGVDEQDAITLTAKDKVEKNLLGLLKEDALKGVRVGVLRQISERPHDANVAALFAASLADLKRLGAVIVDNVEIENFDEISQNHWCRMFRSDLNQYLNENKGRAPVKNLAEVVEHGGFSEYIAEDLRAMLAVDDPTAGGRQCEDIYKDERRVAFRNAVVSAMDKADVSAFIYPSWNYPPGRVGHPEDYKGDNNQLIAPHTGLPAITLPMGYVDGLPAGLQFIGRLFSESEIIPLAYAYEQGTLHRMPPNGFGKVTQKP